MAYDPSVVELIPAFNAGRAAKRDRTDEAYRRDALEAMKDRANKQYIADIAKMALADKAQNYRNEYLQFQKQQEARLMNEAAERDRAETMHLQGKLRGLRGDKGPLTKEQQENLSFRRGLLEADVDRLRAEQEARRQTARVTVQGGNGKASFNVPLSEVGNYTGQSYGSPQTLGQGDSVSRVDRVNALPITQSTMKMVREGKITKEQARRNIKEIGNNLERWEKTYANFVAKHKKDAHPEKYIGPLLTNWMKLNARRKQQSH